MDGNSGQPLATDITDKPRRSRDGRRRSALKHGLRSVALGSMPRGASYVGRLVSEFRRELEREVVAVKGSVSLSDACAINSCCRWERHAQLCQRWLRLNDANMTLDQKLAFSRDIAKASEARDRCLASLRLERDASTILQALYAPLTPPALEDDADGR